jgi:MFS family permease
VLLAALGLGAIAGAFVLPRLRARWSINQLTFIASAVYAAALAGVVLVPSPLVVILLLLPAGVAWITVLSEVNASLQLFLPGWVRARGLSVYQMVLFGSQGAGALVWGLMAGPAGLVATYLVAAGALLAGAATIRLWPFADTSGMDRSLVMSWPEPQLAVNTETTDGPVVVTTTYTVSSERERQFLDAMAKLRQSRLRTGATQWGLFREGETSHRFVEIFVVDSWDEHLRQHRERQTATDQAFEEEVNSLSDPPPETRHLLSAEVSDEPLG